MYIYNFYLQTSSVAALFGAAKAAGPTVLRLHEEHHFELAQTGTDAHKGEKTPLNFTDFVILTFQMCVCVKHSVFLKM